MQWPRLGWGRIHPGVPGGGGDNHQLENIAATGGGREVVVEWGTEGGHCGKTQRQQRQRPRSGLRGEARWWQRIIRFVETAAVGGVGAGGNGGSGQAAAAGRRRQWGGGAGGGGERAAGAGGE